MACALVSATTMATASPTWRALSAGKSALGPMNTTPPPGPVSFMSNLVFGTGSCGIGPSLSAAQSAPVKHAEHARHRFRRRGIDRDNARMRMRRTHHHRISLAVETEIVGETPLAGDQPRIFLARHRLADEAVAGFVRSGFVVHLSRRRWNWGGQSYTAAGCSCSPDGRNPGRRRGVEAVPDYAPLHPGYDAAARA